MNSCEAISQRHEETYSTMHNMCYAPFCVANHTCTCISLPKKERKKQSMSNMKTMHMVTYKG